MKINKYSAILLILLSAGCVNFATITGEQITPPSTLTSSRVVFYSKNHDVASSVNLTEAESKYFKDWLHNNKFGWKTVEIPRRSGTLDWCFISWESQLSLITLCWFGKEILYVGRGQSVILSNDQDSTREISNTVEIYREQ